MGTIFDNRCPDCKKAMAVERYDYGAHTEGYCYPCRKFWEHCGTKWHHIMPPPSMHKFTIKEKE